MNKMTSDLILENYVDLMVSYSAKIQSDVISPG